jgi:hypothetical protein
LLKDNGDEEPINGDVAGGDAADVDADEVTDEDDDDGIDDAVDEDDDETNDGDNAGDMADENEHSLPATIVERHPMSEFEIRQQRVRLESCTFT